MGLTQNAKLALLKKRFKSLNPGVGLDAVDWRAEVGKTESFSEALQDLRFAYPMYRWMKPPPLDQYQKHVLANLRREAEPYGFTVIQLAERRKLSKASKHGGHHNPKAKDRVVGQREFVREYNRRWPPHKKKAPTVKKAVKTRKSTRKPRRKK